MVLYCRSSTDRKDGISMKITIVVWHVADEVSSLKQQLEVLSRSSVEDAAAETEQKLRNLQEDYDRRIKEKEGEQEDKVKQLVKNYETEKMKLEEDHAVLRDRIFHVMLWFIIVVRFIDWL